MDADGGLGFADWVAGRRLSRQPCKRQRRAGGQGLGVPGSAAEAVACLRRDAGQPRWGAQCAGQRISGAGLSFGACKRQRRTDGQGSGAGWVAKVACACAVLLVPSRPSSLPFLPLPFSRLPWSRGALERCVGQHISGVCLLRGLCGRQRRTRGQGLGAAGSIVRVACACAVLLLLSLPLSLPFPPLPFSRLPSPRGALERCVGQRISRADSLCGACKRQRRTSA